MQTLLSPCFVVSMAVVGLSVKNQMHGLPSTLPKHPWERCVRVTTHSGEDRLDWVTWISRQEFKETFPVAPLKQVPLNLVSPSIGRGRKGHQTNFSVASPT